MRPARWLVAALLVAAFSMLSPVAAATTAAPAAARSADHVIHISVDGLNPQLLQQVIDAGRAPTFQRLQAESAWTANARTDYTHTITLPNHTCMLTGLSVRQAAGLPPDSFHGWEINDLPKLGVTLHNNRRPPRYVASTFDVVHDAGLSTGLYVTKDKFVIYEQSYNATTGAANRHGRDKIDSYFFQDDGPPYYSQSMTRRFLTDMAAQHFAYTFVHFRDADSAGHAFGWGSPEYLQGIAAVDRYLGEVLALVERDPALRGRTTVIISADHGGVGTDHSDSTRAVNFTVPVFVWGSGAAPGDLYAMNPDTRTAPAGDRPTDNRPDYAANRQPIRNGDTGNLALKLLGLGPIPGSAINSRQDLRAKFAGDYNHDGQIDSLDYTLWQDTHGSTTDLRADGNHDGRVDQQDYDLWKTSRQATAAAAAAGSK